MTRGPADEDRDDRRQFTHRFHRGLLFRRETEQEGTSFEPERFRGIDPAFDQRSTRADLLDRLFPELLDVYLV